MQIRLDRAEHYDPLTIILHWTTAALVTVQFVVAWCIDLFPSGPLRVDARSFHITAGAVLGLVLLARLTWRITEGRRLPPSDTGVLHVAAKATHGVLYLTLLAMVGVGLFLAWVRGDSLWNLVTIPAFDSGNTTLRHNVQGLHATIGWVIIALVGLHAAAALFHQFVWRDSVLARMLPAANPDRP